MANGMNNKPDPKKDGKQSPKFKRNQTITFWIVIILMLIIMFQFTRAPMGGKTQEISYTKFESMVANGSVVEVQLSGRDMMIADAGGTKYSTYLSFEPDSQFIKELSKAGINVNSKRPSTFMSLFWNILPVLILVGFWLFMMRGMRGSTGQAFSFGKSRARLAMGGKTQVTFKDVAGVDEAKEELEEIVEYLKSPERFQRLGGRIPRGVLLLGRPGTGKTLLAKAVAGEAKVPFYSISGSDFVEMFVGVGASRVRDMFSEAKKNAPCIVFIDEIDAVGRHRGTGLGGGHDEREQTLNQLLVEMDGFDPNDSVIIIAATNRPDVLDPALLRPGRFDRQIVVDLPDIKGRTEILRVHTRVLPISKDVSLEVIARATPGFSGADLANLANEAALLAARKNRKKIEMDDFEEAKDKVTLGKAKKSRVIPEDDKLITAYHEIGHVLTSVFQEKTEPVHKVSIIPRGLTGGATHFLQSDRAHYSRGYLQQSIVGLLGGRCAEEIHFGEITTGASNDIQRVSDIAKKMVTQWGMSDRIGPMVIGRQETEVFLGRDISHQENISDDMAKLIDEEIKTLINTAYEEATRILKDNRQLLDALSQELMEKETLGTDEIYEIILQHVDAEKRSFIQKKYDKAKTLVMEFSGETASDEDQQPEINFNESASDDDAAGTPTETTDETPVTSDESEEK